MPHTANPNDEPPVATLRRAHLLTIDRLLREIVDQGGFGEVKLRVKKGRIYSLTCEVEILCMESDSGISYRGK